MSDMKNDLNYCILKQLDGIEITSNYGKLPLNTAQIEKIQGYIENLINKEIRQIDHNLEEAGEP